MIIMSRHNWDRIDWERSLIEDAEYDVFVEQPWHWEVTLPDSKTVVHVWPTTQKYMVAYDNGATEYEDGPALVEAIDEIFELRVMEKFSNEPESIEQAEAIKAVQDLRKSFV